MKTRKFVLAACIIGLAGQTSARAGVLEFTLTGPDAGTGIEWLSPSSVQTLENPWTSGQGDWIFSSAVTNNIPTVANLLTDKQWWDTGPYAGTAIGMMVGENGSGGYPGSYVVFADTGAPIFTYTGGLSQYNRPFNATFSVGTWTLQSPNGSNTLVIRDVAAPEASTWMMLLTGFVVAGTFGYRTSRKAASIAA